MRPSSRRTKPQLLTQAPCGREKPKKRGDKLGHQGFDLYIYIHSDSEVKSIENQQLVLLLLQALFSGLHNSECVMR